MQNSEWDKHLRDMLGDFRPGDDQPHWEEFARQLDARDTPSDASDPIQDDQLHDTLSHYQDDGDVQGWERIEASLDANDKAFDENVRKKIHRYEPHFDPLAWPAFLKKFADHKLLRIKLISLKVIEFAAILLLIFTVVHMGRLGKLPFETPLYDVPVAPSATMPGDRAAVDPAPSSGNELHNAGTGRDLTVSSSNNGNESENLGTGRDLSASNQIENIQTDIVQSGRDLSGAQPSENILSANTHIDLPVPNSKVSHPLPLVTNPLVAISQTPLVGELNAEAVKGSNHLLPPSETIQETHITDYLAAVSTSLSIETGVVIPAVEYIKSKPGTFLEFSVLTQGDYNKLRMPEDRLYSAGKQIVFPSQGIPSNGFGAGFTVAIGHPLWALETGIIYSGKDFKPGRQLIVGGAFDNGSVEFEAMDLQVISVPIQYRYRFERQGRLKAYALAGLAAHVIATSDIDVVIKYHFPSLAAGADPNHDPYFAQTIRETRRISEHIRDGAPFSTKSYFSANAGLGLEYSLTPHKTLFLQTTAQYQIPNLKFSNNNGKHIRTISLQAGVRTPLGI